MHHLHLELGARMVEEEGWQRPVVYSTVDEEVERLRGAAGLTDISPDGKINLHGNSIGGMVGGALFEAHSREELRIGECAFVAASERPDAPAVLLARLASDEMVAFTGPSGARNHPRQPVQPRRSDGAGRGSHLGPGGRGHYGAIRSLGAELGLGARYLTRQPSRHGLRPGRGRGSPWNLRAHR